MTITSLALYLSYRFYVIFYCKFYNFCSFKLIKSNSYVFIFSVIRCDLEKAQKEYEEKLSKTTEECEKREQSQLSSVRASHKLVLAERDATIVELKDSLDQVNLKMEEREEQFNKNIKELQERLGQAEEKLQCQVGLS